MAILDLAKGFFSLSRKINKVNPTEEETGVISDKLPELTLSMTNDELLAMAKKWKNRWEKESKELVRKQEENENYWLGKQYSEVDKIGDERPLVDNLIFEATETFLPQATRQRPEPIVECSNEELAQKVQKILEYLYDTRKVKLKVKQAVRFWSLRYIGAIKVGWSLVDNEIDLQACRTEDLIFDPDGVTEGGVYVGEFLGHIKREPASDIISRFPNKKQYIQDLVDKDGTGTSIKYIEWWTDEMVFWQLKDEILDKIKNPHFNYDKEVPQIKESVGLDVVDADITNPVEMIKQAGANHFNTPRIPFAFLTVFNLMKHPWDDTSLIEQNLAMQDLINKRQKQIDTNVDNMNGGWVISGDSGLTKEQATLAMKAVRKGNGWYVPTGNPDSVVVRLQSGNLPADVYNSLVDYRNELRSIFGTTGLTPKGLQEENTVRGKIMIKGSDVDRIGGTITEHIEQFCDYIYNLMVQMMYVYYSDEHTATILANGQNNNISLKAEDLTDKLVVSIKEGSLIPKDSLTRRNEAIDLWAQKAIDPLTLFERLEFPNPQESVKRLVEWATNPTTLTGGAVMPPTTSVPPVSSTGTEATTMPPTASNLLNQVPIQ